MRQQLPTRPRRKPRPHPSYSYRTESSISVSPVCMSPAPVALPRFGCHTGLINTSWSSKAGFTTKYHRLTMQCLMLAEACFSMRVGLGECNEYRLGESAGTVPYNSRRLPTDSHFVCQHLHHGTTCFGVSLTRFFPIALIVALNCHTGDCKASFSEYAREGKYMRHKDPQIVL